MKAPILISALSLSFVYAQQQAPATQADVNPPATEAVAEAPAAETADESATETEALTAAPAAEAPAVDQPATAQASSEPEPVMATGTPIQGDISGFIKADQSPYLVTGDITINSNSAVIIEPGVVLQFTPGTGIYSQGQFVIAGSENQKVELRSALKGKSWKGLFISSDSLASIKSTIVDGAENGITIENGSLEIQSAEIENCSARGIYAKNTTLTIDQVQFRNNQGAALHVAPYSDAVVSNTTFEGNNVALYSSPLSITSVASSQFKSNAYALLDMGNSHIAFNNTNVSDNKVGITTTDVLSKEVTESVGENEVKFADNVNAIVQTLPTDPEIPGIYSRPVNPNEKVETLLAQKEEDDRSKEPAGTSWTKVGNIMLGGNYHYVMTRKHHKGTIEIAGDTIKHGDHYENNFQVPGFGGEASVYMRLQSPDGRTIEFNTDLTADSWNYFSPNPVTLSYTDKRMNLVVGDFNKFEGDIYMSSLPVFGISYTLSTLQKNNATDPLLQFSGFFGESRKPYLPDERHPLIYNNYIDDGEAQAQRLVKGASLKWAPLRRFDMTVGIISSDDEIHDPLLRDGASKSTITSEPMQKSMTLYADGNWLFYPGDIELNGQIAVGGADTTDVYRERAVNKVFMDAGLNVASMRVLRKLMTNESKINSLTKEELTEIFGENSMLNRGEMRDSLRTLIREAKSVQSNYEDDRDDDRVMGVNWGSQNFAIGASLNWNIYKTTLEGHIKYVGEDYYSAGSADQLADTREFGGTLEQDILPFWNLKFGYNLNIENAAKYGKTNLFGLGEGTRWGLFNEDDSKWFEEHELDNDRTKYIQNWKLNNNFKIGKNIGISVGYNLEYRSQYRPYQLHGDYILEDEIYRDGWFAARKNKATTEIVDKKDTVLVDSARWAEYNSMASEDYLASKFQERIYRNTWSAEVSYSVFNSTIKVGGRWILRSDDSKFFKDDLINEMDLSNETIAKLGYYFGGADYFEHTYPISVTSKFSRIQNYFSFTPRFKNYERNDMTEDEYTIEDEFEIPFMNRFLILGLSGEFRYLTTEWEENDEKFDESEYDLLGSANLHVNHNSRWSSDWYVGAAMYYRPDNLSDEYKDIYGGVRVNYIF